MKDQIRTLFFEASLLLSHYLLCVDQEYDAFL
jgi:hypothetical protein